MGMIIVDSDALITVNGPGTLIKKLSYIFCCEWLCLTPSLANIWQDYHKLVQIYILMNHHKWPFFLPSFLESNFN